MFKLVKNLNYIWNKFRNYNDDFWEVLEEELILSNVSYETTKQLIQNVKDYSFNENIKDMQAIKEKLKSELINILNLDNPDLRKLNFGSDKPSVFLVVGVNGVGKTSSIAKLANMLKNNGKSVLISAADTFRSAAIEQIQYLGDKFNIEVVHHQKNSDPGAVVYDSLERALAKKSDVVIIDTAGRMQTSSNLIDELKKIIRVIEKKLGRRPDEILLVIDANTGQNAKFQAEVFHNALGVTGIILTKTDSTSKGGIVITIINDLKIPVKLITFGEKINDISYFDASDFVNALLG